MRWRWAGGRLVGALQAGCSGVRYDLLTLVRVPEQLAAVAANLG